MESKQQVHEQGGSTISDPGDAALLARVADTLCGLEYEAWAFGDSVAFEAMVAASRVLGTERWMRFAQGFARGWAAERDHFVELDCTAPGRALVEVAERCDDRRLLAALVELAEHLAARPRLGGAFVTFARTPLQHPFGPVPLSPSEVGLLSAQPRGVFIDCLHFDPPFFVALGRATGEERYVELGIDQALAYVELLQQSDGLFDHFLLEGAPHSFGHRWGRGQGWALLGLLDVIERLGVQERGRAELVAAAHEVMATMLRYQRDDGHFDAALGNARSGIESSTAAFMACGWLRAAELKIAPPGALDAASRGLAAARAATEEGILGGVSIAVGCCTEESHYAFVPRGFIVPWGQGPLALALCAALEQGGGVASGTKEVQ